MKIAVINFSGNVGKSTVARHLLAPRLNDAEILAVESINSDGTDTAALRGSQFDEVQDRLLALRHAVVDIGASNVEDFVTLMERYEGSHEDFDLFIVPTVPTVKQQIDTIATLRALAADIRIPASKIRVVFNMVDPRQDLAKCFSRVFDAHAREKGFVLNDGAVIQQNPIFERIKGINKSILEIKNDPTDYVKLNAEAIETDQPEDVKTEIRQMIALKRLATRVASDLDEVFRVLVP
jgi:MinD-like ATPase involved in chromosome partitioning or flagellar assembly